MNRPLFDANQANINVSNWMKEYLEKSGAKGYIVGLSGGVDSSVVAALAVKAVGVDSVHGVIMPIESNHNDEVDAIKVARQIGITYDVVDLAHAHRAMVTSYPAYYEYIDELLMSSNIKSRLRMTMLYQFAGDFNYLVAGTGNRSEDAVGYFTKYGDGGVDIIPLAEFYKWEIREMAAVLGFPEEIANRISTAGFWEGQTDEKDLGITYEELDNILMFFDSVPDVTLQVPRERADYVLKLINKNEHKTKYPPIYKRD